MGSPRFRTLDDGDFVYGAAQVVAPGLRRVLAENPSKYTYRGTGTYIVGGGSVGRGEVVVIDPGPALASHRAALERALEGERVAAILVTHCHADHSPLAAWLHESTGAPTLAWGPHPAPDPVWERYAGAPDGFDDRDRASEGSVGGSAAGIDESMMEESMIDESMMEESIDFAFAPTCPVFDGERLTIGGLTIEAIHTPGHTSNHTCWLVESDPRSMLFTGDHVMGWSTTVVAPPDGDMADYIASLRKLQPVVGAGAVMWPTHGPPRDDGTEYLAALIGHRLDREAAILATLADDGSSIREVVELLYAEVRRELHRAAARSVWAHLLNLISRGEVEVESSGTGAGDDGAAPTLAARYRRAR